MDSRPSSGSQPSLLSSADSSLAILAKGSSASLSLSFASRNEATHPVQNHVGIPPTGRQIGHFEGLPEIRLHSVPQLWQDLQ